MCKHEIGLLVGTADGIVCKGCGKLFHSFDEISGPVKEEVKPAAEEKPKKARKKKEA